jgi:hypothetical protein
MELQSMDSFATSPTRRCCALVVNPCQKARASVKLTDWELSSSSSKDTDVEPGSQAYSRVLYPIMSVSTRYHNRTDRPRDTYLTAFRAHNCPRSIAVAHSLARVRMVRCRMFSTQNHSSPRSESYVGCLSMQHDEESNLINILSRCGGRNEVLHSLSSCLSINIHWVKLFSTKAVQELCQCVNIECCARNIT